MQAVPPQAWNLDEIQDDDRRRLLLSSLSPEDVLDWVEAEARDAVRKVALRWVDAKEHAGCSRIEAVVPLHKMTFDLFFNGRMGYRAQYYLSVDEGHRFNTRLVERLLPVVQDAAATGAMPVGWATVENSWKGPYSRAWIAVGRAALVHEPKVLRPERWVKHWERSQGVPMGLAAPRPDSPMLLFKGTHVSRQTAEPWRPDGERDRDESIHRSGWT